MRDSRSSPLYPLLTLRSLLQESLGWYNQLVSWPSGAQHWSGLNPSASCPGLVTPYPSQLSLSWLVSPSSALPTPQAWFPSLWVLSSTPSSSPARYHKLPALAARCHLRWPPAFHLFEWNFQACIVHQAEKKAREPRQWDQPVQRLSRVEPCASLGKPPAAQPDQDKATGAEQEGAVRVWR